MSRPCNVEVVAQFAQGDPHVGGVRVASQGTGGCLLEEGVVRIGHTEQQTDDPCRNGAGHQRHQIGGRSRVQQVVERGVDHLLDLFAHGVYALDREMPGQPTSPGEVVGVVATDEALDPVVALLNVTRAEERESGTVQPRRERRAGEYGLGVLVPGDQPGTRVLQGARAREPREGAEPGEASGWTGERTEQFLTLLVEFNQSIEQLEGLTWSRAGRADTPSATAD